MKDECIPLFDQTRHLNSQGFYETRVTAIQCKQKSLKKSLTNQHAEGVSRNGILLMNK